MITFIRQISTSTSDISLSAFYSLIEGIILGLMTVVQRLTGVRICLRKKKIKTEDNARENLFF